MVNLLALVVLQSPGSIASFPYEETTLTEIAAYIHEQSGVVVVPPAALKDRVIYVHWEPQPVDAVVEGLAYGLGLKATRDPASNTWTLTGNVPVVPEGLKGAIAEALTDVIAKSLPYMSMSKSALKQQNAQLREAMVAHRSEYPHWSQEFLDKRDEDTRVRRALEYYSIVPVLASQPTSDWISRLLSGRFRESAFAVPPATSNVAEALAETAAKRPGEIDSHGPTYVAVATLPQPSASPDWWMFAYTASSVTAIGHFHVQDQWQDPSPLKTSPAFSLLDTTLTPPTPEYALPVIHSVEILPSLAAQAHRSVACWCSRDDVVWDRLPTQSFKFAQLLNNNVWFGRKGLPGVAAFEEHGDWIRLCEKPSCDVAYRINWTRLLPILRKIRKHEFSLEQIRTFVKSVPEPLAIALNDVVDERPNLSREDSGMVGSFFLARAVCWLPTAERKRIGKNPVRWSFADLPSDSRDDIAKYESADGNYMSALESTHPDFQSVMESWSISAVRVTIAGKNWIEVDLDRNKTGTSRCLIPIAGDDTAR